MDIEKNFIEVTATDTVQQVIDKVRKYREDNEDDVNWLVVSPLGPPWEFSIVKTATLHMVPSADRGKSLEATLGGYFQSTDFVSKAVLLDDNQDVRMVSDSPALIVQKTIGLFVMEKERGKCISYCPYDCNEPTLPTEVGQKVACLRCGKQFWVIRDKPGRKV